MKIAVVTIRAWNRAVLADDGWSVAASFPKLDRWEVGEKIQAVCVANSKLKNFTHQHKLGTGEDDVERSSDIGGRKQRRAALLSIELQRFFRRFDAFRLVRHRYLGQVPTDLPRCLGTYHVHRGQQQLSADHINMKN
ncbi:hypothetical protein IF1G_08648 [Cordyceps javanica]|uniref:Uncharacterized protein n=1 Tax=Cordyceps javanica TaxID=43265 RepID=A0A545UTE1_9HYPO|nr:hypothetical protein IF1G_08648 [Cordyceps javanica]